MRSGTTEGLLRRRLFAIDASTGMIVNLEKLDAEDASSYTVNVVAVDLTSTVGNPRVTSAEVREQIAGTNTSFTQYHPSMIGLYYKLSGIVVIVSIKKKVTDKVVFTKLKLVSGSQPFKNKLFKYGIINSVTCNQEDSCDIGVYLKIVNENKLLLQFQVANSKHLRFLWVNLEMFL